MASAIPDPDEKFEDDEEPSDLPEHLAAKLLSRRASVSMPDLDVLVRIHEERERLEEEDEAAAAAAAAAVAALGEGTSLGPRPSIHITRPSITPAPDNTSDGSDEGSDANGSEDDPEAPKIPLRRKSKLLPPRLSIVKSNFLKTDAALPSPSPSTGSVNSISNLLRDKLVMTVPGVLKKKQPREYKLQAFVAILFLAIVFLVGFAYVFYHQQVLQRAYFERIRFNQDERVIHVYNHIGVEVVTGNLGTSLPEKMPAYPCRKEHMTKEDDVCIEWEDRARFAMHRNYFAPQNVRCYQIVWRSLNKDVHPTDCYDISERKGYWYGGGESSNIRWPLKDHEMDMSPFVTGYKEFQAWGNVLQRYFLNSKGGALVISDSTPLYVGLPGGKEQLCLQAKYDDFAYVYHNALLPVLNYTICTAEDITAMHTFLADTDIWDGLTEDNIKAAYRILERPLWKFSLKNIVTESVTNHTDDIAALAFMDKGYIVFDEFWQSDIGELVMDESRFPQMVEVINLIHRRGYQVALTVQPYVSTHSTHYEPGIEQGYWVRERHSDVPDLTTYKTVHSAAMLDVTNNRSIPWFSDKLKQVLDKYHVDAFFLDLGTSQDFPRYYDFRRTLYNPDHYLNLFFKAMAGSLPILGVNSAITLPRVPAFVTLSPSDSTWKALQQVIPTVLAVGVVGYPFIIPGAIGGDRFEGGNITTPPKDLYIRWMELAHFMPVVHYGAFLPNDLDSNVVEIARNYTKLRQSMINDLIRKYAREALNTGLPIIRPLWMLDPQDQNCLRVGDQFSIGNELIVAPILESGGIEREIYLPKGVWKDGLDGGLRRGERWIHNYRIRLNQIAYFLRQPDDTRLMVAYSNTA